MYRLEPLRRHYCVFLLLLVLLCGAKAFAAESARPQAWAQPVVLQDSENFFQVTPYLYRSAQPSAKGMRAYEKFGIRTVINLRARHSDDDEARGTNLTLVHIPTRTRNVAADEVVVRALQAIRDAEKPVLVHCMHGADRTGLIMAMYRIVEQGWTKEAALDEMRNGGFGFHSIWIHIPKYIANADVERIRARLR